MPTKDANESNIYSYFLEILDGADTGSFLELNQKTTIGKKDADIVFNLDTLADVHCSFLMDNQIVSLVDHATNYGTKVDGLEIPSGRMFILEDQDIIEVGGISLKLRGLTKEECIELNLINQDHLDFGEASDKTGEFNLNDLDDSGDKSLIKKLTSTITGIFKKLKKPKSNEMMGDDALNEVDREELFNQAESQDEESPDQVSEKLSDLIAQAKTGSESSEEGHYEKLDVGGEEPEELTVFKKILRAIGLSKKKNKIGVMVVRKKEVAPFYVRAIAFIGDLCIAILVYQVIREEPAFVHFDEIVTDIFNNIPLFLVNSGLPSSISSVLIPLLEIVASYFSLIIVFFAIKLVFNLLVAVSLMQVFMGLVTEGKFIKKNLRAFNRTLIEFVTFPFFLLLDSPSLFRKPTLKEKITNTKIIVGTKIGYFGIVIILMLISVVLISPILSPITLVDGVIVSKEKRVKRTIINEQEVVKNLASSKLHLSIQNPESSGFEILPMIKIPRNYKKTKNLDLGLILYHHKNDVIGTLELKNNIFDIQKYLKLNVEYNPLFKNNFSRLNKIYDKTELFRPYKLSAKKRIKNAKLVNNNTYTELESLYLFTLKLNLETFLLENLTEYGPFNFGYVSSRNLMLKSFNSKIAGYQNEFVSILEFDKMSFLKFPDLSLKGMKNYYLMPSRTLNPLIYKVSWAGRSQKINKTNIQFNNKVLSQMNFHLDYKDFFGNFPASFKKEEFNLLQALDFFPIKYLKASQRLAFDQEIYQQYFDLAKLGFEKGLKPNYFNALRKSAQSILDVLNIVKSPLNQESLNELETNLLEYLEAIKLKNESFFGIVRE